MESMKFKVTLGILRLSMGLIFLWAFFDKLLGLSYATTPEKSWLAGGSPTAGFLQYGVHGPLANFYHSIAGSGLVERIFMIGLLFIGITLTFGVAVRLGAMAGALMMVLMYSALIPPENHPFIDEHFIYFLVMLVLMFSESGKYVGLANSWSRTAIVQKYSFLK